MASWPRFKLDEASKAWLACAIDSEGTIHSGQSHGNPYHSIEISNTSQAFLQKAKDICGCGNIYPRPHNTALITENGKKYTSSVLLYRWSIGRREYVKEILEAVIPYLIIKKEKAQKVVAWIDTHPKYYSYLERGGRQRIQEAVIHE